MPIALHTVSFTLLHKSKDSTLRLPNVKRTYGLKKNDRGPAEALSHRNGRNKVERDKENDDYQSKARFHHA